ncbi:hypothetical protein ACQJBY_047555 [Aegilops geniculata]
MHADQLVPAVVAAVAVVCLLIAGRADGQLEYVPATASQVVEPLATNLNPGQFLPQPEVMPVPSNLLAKPEYVSQTGFSLPEPSLAGAFTGSYLPQQPTTQPEPQPESQTTKWVPETQTTKWVPEPTWQKPGTPSVPAQPSTSGGSYAGGGANKQVDDDGEPVDGLSPKAIENILKEHNAFRAKEHVPPLTWNATVAQYAQHYANERKGDCALKHSTGPYGENLMYGEGRAWTWRHTVDEWSEEKQNYHYGTNSCDAGKQCGHYTAVVWKHTTAVGCGRVTCTSGDTLMVCSYYPAGNYDGEKPF